MARISAFLRGAVVSSAIGALTAGSVSVQAATFGAGIENSQWYLSESVFECTLVHQVPGYGRAVFRHKAGESLSFFLESETPLMRPGQLENSEIISGPYFGAKEPIVITLLAYSAWLLNWSLGKFGLFGSSKSSESFPAA